MSRRVLQKEKHVAPQRSEAFQGKHQHIDNKEQRRLRSVVKHG